MGGPDQPIVEPVNTTEITISPIMQDEAVLFLDSVKALMVWRHGPDEEDLSIKSRTVSDLPRDMSHMKLMAMGSYREDECGEHVSIGVGRVGMESGPNSSSLFLGINPYSRLMYARRVARTGAVPSDSPTRVEGTLTFLQAKTGFYLLRNSIAGMCGAPNGMGVLGRDELVAGLAALDLLEKVN
jgi:hypothetical protein